jgi:hypothetical protein
MATWYLKLFYLDSKRLIDLGKLRQYKLYYYYFNKFKNQIPINKNNYMPGEAEPLGLSRRT